MPILRISLLLSLICSVVPTALAQVIVRGTVNDGETGDPMESVTVFIEGTSIGTTTSSDGTYELELRLRG